MQNKRETPRRTVSMPATIENGHARMVGVMLDVSQTGARLKLAPGAFLASQCVLTAPLFASPVPCRIVWRRGQEIGLRFKAAVVANRDGGPRSKVDARFAASGFGRR